MAAAIGDLARSTGIEIRTLPMAASTSNTHRTSCAWQILAVTQSFEWYNSRNSCSSRNCMSQLKQLIIQLVQQVTKTIRVASQETHMFMLTAGGAINLSDMHCQGRVQVRNSAPANRSIWKLKY